MNFKINFTNPNNFELTNAWISYEGSGLHRGSDWLDVGNIKAKASKMIEFTIWPYRSGSKELGFKNFAKTKFIWFKILNFIFCNFGQNLSIDLLVVLSADQNVEYKAEKEIYVAYSFWSFKILHNQQIPAKTIKIKIKWIRLKIKFY